MPCQYDNGATAQAQWFAVPSRADMPSMLVVSTEIHIQSCFSEKPRHVEVKLKCKPPKASESPSAVSIYLLEPKTCEYVLGVESSIVCDIIASADEDGLMSLTKADFNKVDVGMNPDSTKNIDEREYVKFTLEDAIISNVNINEEEEDEEEDPDQNE